MPRDAADGARVSDFYPDPDIDLGTFFTSYVPERFAAEGGSELVPDDPDRALYVEVGGWGWTLRHHGGRVHVTEGADGPAMASLRLTEEDWRDAITGALAGGFEPSEADWERAKKRGRLTPEVLEKLDALRGRVRVVVRHFMGRDWTAELVVGPEDEADKTATVKVGAMDAEQLLQGRKDPVRAYTSGDVEIEGAERFAVALGAIFLPELARAKRRRFGR